MIILIMILYTIILSDIAKYFFNHLIYFIYKFNSYYLDILINFVIINLFFNLNKDYVIIIKQENSLILNYKIINILTCNKKKQYK